MLLLLLHRGVVLYAWLLGMLQHMRLLLLLLLHIRGILCAWLLWMLWHA